jgi:hypothetical protein
MPSTPVTERVGRQVRLSSASTGSVVVGRVGPPSAPQAQGKRFQTSSPRMAAVAFACSIRSAGISQCRLPGRSRPRLRILEPVEHLAQDAKARRHQAARVAEWMPSVRISTLSVPVMLPRRLVVSQSWS